MVLLAAKDRVTALEAAYYSGYTDQERMAELLCKAAELILGEDQQQMPVAFSELRQNELRRVARYLTKYALEILTHD